MTADTRTLARIYACVAEMHALHARVQGMVAENNHRLACGDSVAYREEQFDHEESRLMCCSNTLSEIARGG
jgi:hypothetical protein